VAPVEAIHVLEGIYEVAGPTLATAIEMLLNQASLPVSKILYSGESCQRRKTQKLPPPTR
jgi:hypothetical protein